MKVIVVSYPGMFEGEHDILTQLFEEGLANFHVLKPNLSPKHLKEYLEAIPKKFRKRVILHGYQNKDLVKTFKLKGLHINSGERRQQFFTATRVSILKLSCPGIHLSTTYHSLKNVKNAPFYYDYVSLDNIFRSQSREVFKSHYDWTEIENTLHHQSNNKRIMARGGVTEKKLPMLRNLGFSGVFVKSAIWEAANPVEAFKSMKEVAKNAKRQQSNFYNYDY